MKGGGSGVGGGVAGVAKSFPFLVSLSRADMSPAEEGEEDAANWEDVMRKCTCYKERNLGN
jgi:hypothetical protein